MTRWSAALTHAGIRSPQLREDYDAQRRLVRRFDRHAYLAARLLLPSRFHPLVVAAVAFMHHTDELIDSGDVNTRQETLRSWSHQVTEALHQGSDQSVLRALADTVRRSQHMADRVRDFLDGATVEAAWTGFRTEDDFQAYVRRYSLPALMLTASLFAPPPGSDRDAPFHQGCLKLIEAWQRIDHLADLREDAENDKIGIPLLSLAEYGLKPEDLRRRPSNDPAVSLLVRAQADLAGHALGECRTLPDLVEDEFRPFVRTLISMQELRLEALRRAGGAVLEEDEVRPSAVAAVRVLARQTAVAWRMRRR
ncbi:squalene/phytoene synthase family protein [Streptomyces sp. CC219B]|uniref:phytoene/squalene synthase family protein n=1 Tax=Streptomyces sp. CC219B TaxID=3044574 RepID=UPI0024A80C39|nr:squalene/phytoene synthase family protein [Streptomyces sp. CC219B]